jgi:hypothetical protein
MAETNRRLQREVETIALMVRLFCQAHHSAQGEFCAECAALLDYARQRLDRCRYTADKPTCAACPIHCYKPAMRERIRQVMRYAGPRMLYRHPTAALRHLLDARRKPPPMTEWPMSSQKTERSDG